MRGRIFSALVLVAALTALSPSGVTPTAARTGVPVPVLSHQAYIKASNTDIADNFGVVAMSGNTMVVGAPFEDTTHTDAGAVYVFVRSNGVWTEQAFLQAGNADAGDEFGQALAISGDTIVVGTDEEDSAETGVNQSGSDNTAGGSGAAYVFVLNDGAWSEQAYLKASNTEALDRFGETVAIHGDTIVVGAPLEDSTGSGENNNDAEAAGAAYVFTRSGVVWAQQAYIKASAPTLGDHFGDAVGVSGNTLVVGAPNEDSNATGIDGAEVNELAGDSGAAYVFTRSGTTWTKQASLKSSNSELGDKFGGAVDIDTNTIVVGAVSEDSDTRAVDGDQDSEAAQNAGAAYAFFRTGSAWSQQAYLKPINSDGADQFGTAVGVDGNAIVVGAQNEDSAAHGTNVNATDGNAFNAGSAYVFTREGSLWSWSDYLKASDTGAADHFGASVDVSAGSVVVGASNEDSNATGINGDASDNSLESAGAAYAFGAACTFGPFADVPVSHPFCPEIEWMKQTRVSTGFPDGTYKGSDSVTRQAMSAFLARLTGAVIPDDCFTPPFTDVPVDHPFCPEIEWMKLEGISTGFNDGTYRPSLPVTRQAMAAFMARAADVVEILPECTSPPFSDVAANHPFCKEIDWIRDEQISTGFSDGTYRPNENVTRQAMSAFMYRLAAYLIVRGL